MEMMTNLEGDDSTALSVKRTEDVMSIAAGIYSNNQCIRDSFDHAIHVLPKKMSRHTHTHTHNYVTYQ